MSGNYVYVMRYADFDHKIGFSVDPDIRLHALRPFGAIRVVQKWHCPHGDAARVESVAHRIASSWRLPIMGQRERFKLSEQSACAAVTLAVNLVEDESGRRTLKKEPPREVRLIQLPPIHPVPLLQGATPTATSLRMGYVGGRKPEAQQEGIRRLVRAGVDEGRIYQETASRPGQAWVAVMKAVRQGDTLVLAARKRMTAAEIAILAERGVEVQEARNA